MLDRNADGALLLSKNGLCRKPYNEQCVDTTWEKCTLRKWLNGEFLNQSFSAEERASIRTTKVTADKNPDYSTPSGNDTNDKIFLLSIPEVKRYFSSDQERNIGSVWWLRSPGDFSRIAAYVILDGSVHSSGRYVNDSYGVIRPALWVKY